MREALYQVLLPVYDQLSQGLPALEAVVRACRLLEDDPRFNAGTGSVLQSDGQIRMSASLMDGPRRRFSGVINVSRVQHPIDLALALQSGADRTLSDQGGAELARELGLPPYDPLTEARLQEWLQERRGESRRAMAGVVVESPGRGTIGAVALDNYGQLAAATSTGGKGFERLGRVSDSATPAGNYASPAAAVSCTGIGEDIIEECLAARIVIRVEDGADLETAFRRSLAGSQERGRDLGAIGIDARGTIGWGKTSQTLLAAYHDGDTPGDTLGMDHNWGTGVA